MKYYEVFIADGRYHGDSTLTYSSNEKLKVMSVVSVPLRNRLVTAFVTAEVDKPDFVVKPIKSILSSSTLPAHSFKLAKWLSSYYAVNLGDALRQFAPSKPSIRRIKSEELFAPEVLQLELETELTDEQEKTVELINKSPSTTLLLHGETGSGKTRVYLELAKQALESGHSVQLLTPEIALTSQLATAVEVQLDRTAYVFHSQLTTSERKKIWLAILEAKEPVVVVGPRSALFAPVQKPGLIVLDEAHETAYKQDQSPRYHAARVASQMGTLTGAKVVLGTATPLVTDYFIAEHHGAIARMSNSALGGESNEVKIEIVDIRQRQNFGSNPHLSKTLVDAIKQTLVDRKQALIYLNRRGSARQILCDSCGWQMLCPNCDIPLIYHGDTHLARCHICNFSEAPPSNCPKCSNPDIIYKSIGTKALTESVSKLFPDARVQRFDSDNLAGERLNEAYSSLRSGKVDILVGTQLLAKGLDLPRLGLVGIVAAETSLALPDYTSEERSFQLLYQVAGRVGRGHGSGTVIVQSFNPDSVLLASALSRDWQNFYQHTLSERQAYRFPPFSYLMQLSCRRATSASSEDAANKLIAKLASQKLPVELIGPTPSFYVKRGKNYYWQIVAKSKDRKHLLELTKLVPSDWTINLDPVDLL